MGDFKKAWKLVSSGVLACALAWGQHGGAGRGGGPAVGAVSPSVRVGGSQFSRPAVPGSIPSYGPNSYPGSQYGARAGVSNSRSYHSGSGYPARNSYRSYRRVPSTYFFTPYYYPFLDYGSSPYYGDDALSYPDYSAGSDPALTDQVARLSAEVNELRNNLMQQSSPPPPPGYGVESAPPAQPEAPAPASAPVTIVLSGGQTLQVQNYAVMDNVFWDFSRQPARQIPVSTIDIPASVKATEANGAEFPLRSRP